MKTVICGSRELANDLAVCLAIESCPWVDRITEVVSGAARGADAGGEAWARRRGIPVSRFPADWDAHGKRAGMIRNQQMAQYADACIAMPAGISRGTRHSMRLFYGRPRHVAEMGLYEEFTLWSVEAPHFSAAMMTQDGVAVEAAPILAWTVGRSRPDLHDVFRSRGWVALHVCTLPRVLTSSTEGI